MSRGQPAYVDEELDQALEKMKELGDFSTKRKASKKAGEILNGAFENMLRDVGNELNDAVSKADKKEEPGFFTDTGVSHEMLGFQDEEKHRRSKF